jgi:hypothetical protein
MPAIFLVNCLRFANFFGTELRLANKALYHCNASHVIGDNTEK